MVWNLPLRNPVNADSMWARSAVGCAFVASVLLVIGWAGHGGAGAATLLAGVGFVMALVALRQHVRWAPLWLPLLLFPVLLLSAPLWV